MSGVTNWCSSPPCPHLWLFLLLPHLSLFIHGSEFVADSESVALSQISEHVVDREAVLGQDPRCDEFVYSVLMPEDSLAGDSSSSVMNSFFGMSPVHKRSREYRFQTPNYPGHFPDNVECIKIIAAPSKDQRILLNFRGLFEIEPESRCIVEFLEIRDGAFGFSPLFGRFCGRRLPNIGTGLKSRGPYMWLRFRSDASIPHRGFQAVFRFFQAPANHPVDSVYRFRHRMDLTEGELWNLKDSFLLDQLRDQAMTLQQQQRMPIEAVFDIRAPLNDYIMIHVVNVTVPREFAWSCSPAEHLEMNTVPRCRADMGRITGMKVTSKDFEVPDIEIDPASIIDGRETVIEVYPRNTISAYSPPCPKTRRFCDNSLGVPHPPDKEAESDRDFYIRGPRVVIRVIIASPSQAPNKKTRELSGLISGAKMQVFVNRTHHQRTKRNPAMYELEQMPTFHFQITALKRASRDAQNPCNKSWTSCDAETCVPESFWCDKIYNCPKWQDEGVNCDYMKDRSPVEQGKSLMELRKEQEKREAEAEERAAQRLHLSILASLGLALLITTLSCVLTTLRRRWKERRRQSIKVKDAITLSPTAQQTGMNHVSSSRVMVRRETKRPKEKLNSIKAKPCKDPSKSEIIWNSNDSMNAPLLRSVPPGPTPSRQRSGEKLQRPRYNQTAPCDLVFKDMHPSDQLNLQRLENSIDLALTTTQPTSKRIELGGNFSVKVHQPMPSSFTPIHSKSTIQRHSEFENGNSPLDSPSKRTIRSGQWVVGSYSPTKRQPRPPQHASWTDPHLLYQNARSDPHTHVKSKVTPETEQPTSSAEHHLANCRLLGRTQSWGGNLRLAGVTPLHNGQWEVTHSSNHEEHSLDQLPSVQVYPVHPTGTEQFPKLSAHMSMPNMKDDTWVPIATEQQQQSDTRKPTVHDCKPPVAKRPRMTSVQRTWVPTAYNVDSDVTGSSNEGGSMLNEHGSVRSEACMPELLQEDIGLSVNYTTPGLFYDLPAYFGQEHEKFGSGTPSEGSTVSVTESVSDGTQQLESVSENESRDNSVSNTSSSERMARYFYSARDVECDDIQPSQTSGRRPRPGKTDTARCIYEYEA